MKPKLTFTICCVLIALIGISMLVFAEQVTLRNWPDADPYAPNLGIVLRYLLGANIIGFSCIFFQARNILDVESAKQVLFGAAVGHGLFSDNAGHKFHRVI